VTLSFGGVDGKLRRRKLWARSGLGLQFDSFYLQEHYAEISPPALFIRQTQHRARCCCFSSHSCVPWPSAWRHAAAWLAPSRSGFCGHHCQKSLIHRKEEVLSLPMPPSLQSCTAPSAEDFVRSDGPLSASALFSIVQQLWLCVFGFTTQEKRACCHLYRCGGLYD